MRVVAVSEEVQQFGTYVERIDFTMNQYLISGDEPMLVQTGPVSIAGELVEKVKETLRGGSPAYVFISHFESDECGGLALLLEHFPKIKPICSETTARQLAGFGIYNSSLVDRDRIFPPQVSHGNSCPLLYLCRSLGAVFWFLRKGFC